MPKFCFCLCNLSIQTIICILANDNENLQPLGVYQVMNLKKVVKFEENRESITLLLLFITLMQNAKTF